ncbi:MAG: Lrp/AsnC ligand binding domain-containing protein [Chitinophagales bacterium]|nr:Lrp/AsnC ligand binding domain-containing protein [Chitinophagales bacterium]
MIFQNILHLYVFYCRFVCSKWVVCAYIAGAYDYLMKVAVRDIDDYQRFVKEKLAGLENIGRVQSHFVMTEVKNTTQLPV